MKALMTALDYIAGRLQTGVVTNFEQIAPPDPSSTLNCLRKVLLVHSGATGSWPIPESFFPDSTTTSLVRRYFHFI